MFRYGKTVRQAVAAISYVAERQAAGAKAVPSTQTAAARKTLDSATLEGFTRR